MGVERSKSVSTPRLLVQIRDLIKISLPAFLGAAFLHLLASTWRWKIVGNDTAEFQDSGAKIMAFWHNQQLIIAQVYKRLWPRHALPEMHTLISEHSDGRLVARLVRYFGLRSVAGSSTRGGTKAAYRLIKILQEGHSVAITPDGPRGPLYKVKSGVIKVAERGEAPIYTLSAGFDRAWTFGSWDRMVLPKPFARVVILVGKPIRIESGVNPDTEARHASALEAQLEAHRLESSNHACA